MGIGNARIVIILSYAKGKFSAIVAEKEKWSMSEDSVQVWLWKNGDHYLGYTNLYPCHSNGDPMVLGEPIGYARIKSSLPRELFGQQIAIGGLNLNAAKQS